jgi:hypothetical protein
MEWFVYGMNQTSPPTRLTLLSWFVLFPCKANILGGLSSIHILCLNLSEVGVNWCRFEGYVYDEDEDGLGASKDADFSPNPCSRLSKGFMKKVGSYMLTCRQTFQFNSIYF